MKFQERNHSAPPSWLRWFVSDASKGILDQASIAPLGCHFYHDAKLNTWEISIFVSRTEVVGGPGDGRMIGSGLLVDVGAVIAAFDQLPSLHWQSEAVCDDDQLGNHISLEGIARGHQVWLRILHEAPAEFSPGRLLHASHGFLEDLW